MQVSLSVVANFCRHHSPMYPAWVCFLTAFDPAWIFEYFSSAKLKGPYDLTYQPLTRLAPGSPTARISHTLPAQPPTFLPVLFSKICSATTPRPCNMKKQTENKRVSIGNSRVPACIASSPRGHAVSLGISMRTDRYSPISCAIPDSAKAARTPNRREMSVPSHLVMYRVGL